MSRHIPFVDLLGQVIFGIELDGATPPVNAEYILNQAAVSLDEDTMVALAVTQFEGWTRTEDIANAIFSIFGQAIGSVSLAHKLKAMGFQHSHRPFSVFKITKSKLKVSSLKGIKGFLPRGSGGKTKKKRRNPLNL